MNLPTYPDIDGVSFSQWLEDAGYMEQDFPYGHLDSKYEDCYESFKEEMKEISNEN